MPEPRPIRWLHLSDLHLGCRGEALWWQMLPDFERSLRNAADHLGPPDLLLISGDIANSGIKKEYEQADRFLSKLFGWLQNDGAPEPLVITVPGNHDLRRPKNTRALPYRPLERYYLGSVDPDVETISQELWKERKSTFIRPLFSEYQKWFDRSIRPDLERRASKVHFSHFPGDLSVELKFEGTFPLCIVGLNSTWQQYNHTNFERKLRIPAEQFHAALPHKKGDSPLDVFQRNPRSILMMHHPPGWLSKEGRRIFDESIYLPERFDLCVHGHLHEGRTDQNASSGGRVRCYVQSPSLFGLEGYGTDREERIFGYAWGELSADGAVRIWPLNWVRRGDGQGEFVHDNGFHEDKAGLWTGVLVRPAGRLAPVSSPKEDLSFYLEALVDSTDHINISGIARAGRTRGATRYPIERLYTPLRSRGSLDSPREPLERASKEPIQLSDLLPRHRRLLLEGQPGAGKTTFLRLTACMLARDALERECPEGLSWRSHFLGLREGKAPVPVFLRIAELLAVLPRKGIDDHVRDDRHRLIDLLEKIASANRYTVSRKAWEDLLEGEEALLLLDGLDEVADERLRERVFDVFRDACRRWKCPIIVTSRPIQTAALREMSFHSVTVEPFGDREIRTFLDQWVAALYGAETPEALLGEGKRYRDDLVGAIAKVPQIRLLATNPVMLTCMAVVHWNEGRLPEGRSRVYRAVITWLLRARTLQRNEELNLRDAPRPATPVSTARTDLFAERAFAHLALSMTSAPGGKRIFFDLDEAVAAIDPVMREFEDLSPEERRHRSRLWIRYECLGSGIIEEVAGNQIRFWHLTFQEFLAALQLAWRDDDEKSFLESWWPLVKSHLWDSQWRETIELLPGCLLDEGGTGRVDRLFNRILDLAEKKGRIEAPLATRVQVAALIVKLKQITDVYGYPSNERIIAACRSAPEVYEGVFNSYGRYGLHWSLREEIASALGRGGDPRFFGNYEKFISCADSTSTHLGKFPVVVGEYQSFIEQRGYEDIECWSSHGWECRIRFMWKEPEDWGKQLEVPNRPVVGVSWYEASAYCSWLGRQRNVVYRLPTEWEWESAATSPSGEYPWGTGEPDDSRANFWNQVGNPTPVGIFPYGNGPRGHCDLAGNVWEWCMRDDLEGLTEEQPVRGGSFLSGGEVMKTTYRSVRKATFRDRAFGFRVARVE